MLAFFANLSIRYKILILLTSVPMVVLGVYLFVAIQIYKDDKIYYVFETSSGIVKTLQGRVSGEVDNFLVQGRPILQDFLDQGSFSSLSRSIMGMDTKFEWIAVFSSWDLNGKPIDSIENESGAFVAVQSQVAKKIEPLLSKKKRIVSFSRQGESLVVAEQMEIGTGSEQEKKLVFVFSKKVPALTRVFAEPGQTKNYLITRQGEIIRGPGGELNKNLSESIDLPFLSAEDPGPLQTAETTDRTGESFLISFVGLYDNEYFVVSTVPKKSALAAIDRLVKRSYLFFVMLVSLTVLISFFAAAGVTKKLLALFEATSRVADGNFNIRVDVESHDEIGSLGTNFNRMAEEVARLVNETAEKARMEGELKTAQTVQETLFPQPVKDYPGCRIMGFYEPASECGGDWWHHCEIGGKVFLWIGDATGHGAPAALITSAAKSAATIIERLNIGPGEALELLNRSVFEVSRGKIMMTFFIGCYDPESRKLTYANASHEPPYLLKGSILRSADVKPKKKDLLPLNGVQSPRLGQAPSTQFPTEEVQLDAGDRILFFTDGIPDIKSPEGELWSEREFLKAYLAANLGGGTVDASFQNFVTTFQTYRQSSALIDDITFFIFEAQDNREKVA